MALPFIGPSAPTQSVNVGVQRLLNLYVEVTEAPNEPLTATFYGRPGLTRLVTVPDQPGRALVSQDGRVWAVVGGTLVELFANHSYTVRGPVANDGRPCSLHVNGPTGHQLFVVSGGHGYILDLLTHAFSEITAGFPPGALMGEYMEGYFVALWPDHLQISALKNGLLWNAADTAVPSIGPERLVSCRVNHRELWLFGDQTTEIWYNAGTATFPLAPVPGVFVQMGAAAPASPARIDNRVAWLGQNEHGMRLVLLADQYSPRRISTHAVEWALKACPTIDDFIGFSYQEAGHTCYVLTSPINQMTWVWDASVPEPYAWSERSWWNTPLAQDEAHRASAHAMCFGEHWVLDRETGAVYRQTLGVYNDDGAPIRSCVRLPHLTQENRMLFYGGLELGIEPGVGLPTGQGADPILMLRRSDDGGHTWSFERWVTAGRQGAYGTRAWWNREGRSRNRVVEIVQTDPVKRVWIWAAVDAQAGTS